MGQKKSCDKLCVIEFNFKLNRLKECIILKARSAEMNQKWNPLPLRLIVTNRDS